jgi:hypothetical protein
MSGNRDRPGSATGHRPQAHLLEWRSACAKMRARLCRIDALWTKCVGLARAHRNDAWAGAVRLLVGWQGNTLNHGMNTSKGF